MQGHDYLHRLPELVAEGYALKDLPDFLNFYMSEGNISLNRISLSCVAAMGNKINNSV
jgi:hypothetical protein